MQKKKYTDKDGLCFASIANGRGCKLLGAMSPYCGTYMCSFYKPAEAEAWIRVDRENFVLLVPEEEYFTKHNNWW